MHIKDWKRFQHYKDRNPPWVKLHNSLLDDTDYHELNPEAAKVLPLIWLVASEYSTDGSLPDIKRLAFRLHYASNVLAELIKELNHWIIIDDSDMLAPCKQDATPETETEAKGETKAKGEEETKQRACALDTEFSEFWSAYPNKKKKQNARKAYEKARKAVSAELILTAVYRQKGWTEWKKDGGKYIPHPATWLNGGCWDDEQQPTEVASRYTDIRGDFR